MKAFSYSEACRNLSEVLVLAQSEEVEIHERDGTVFCLKSRKISNKSPFDVPGTRTKATTQDVLDAVRDSRSG